MKLSDAAVKVMEVLGWVLMVGVLVGLLWPLIVGFAEGDWASSGSWTHIQGTSVWVKTGLLAGGVLLVTGSVLVLLWLISFERARDRDHSQTQFVELRKEIAELKQARTERPSLRRCAQPDCLALVSVSKEYCTRHEAQRGDDR